LVALRNGVRDLFSVVEEEKGEKARQNPEDRAENSEPERAVPVCLSRGIGFCLVHSLGFLVGIFHFARFLERVMHLEALDDINDILFHRFPFIAGCDESPTARGASRLLDIGLIYSQCVGTSSLSSL
jgi:hypothetical protein